MDVRQVTDRLALEQLAVDYAYAIDTRDFDALDRVFTPDAYIDYRAVGGIDGRYPEVKRWLGQALAGFPNYMHLMGNCSYQIDGDRAVGKVACFNPMVVPTPDGSTQTMMLGLWYHDRYLRTAGGWRIGERVETKCFDAHVPEWMRQALAAD